MSLRFLYKEVKHMLIGQAIGLSESLLISLVGMGVVMLELALLALFVLVLSRAVGAIAKKKPAPAVAASTAPAPVLQQAAAVAQGDDFTDEELACVVAATIAQSGADPSQLRFNSIQVTKP